MASALRPLLDNSSANAWMRSVRRAPSTTDAPSAASIRAVASPSPLLAPVMTTTFPLMLLLIILTPACHAAFDKETIMIWYCKKRNVWLGLLLEDLTGDPDGGHRARPAGVEGQVDDHLCELGFR